MPLEANFRPLIICQTTTHFFTAQFTIQSVSYDRVLTGLLFKFSRVVVSLYRLRILMLGKHLHLTMLITLNGALGCPKSVSSLSLPQINALKNPGQIKRQQRELRLHFSLQLR